MHIIFLPYVICFTLLVSLLMPSAIIAQEKLSMESITAEAMYNNPQIQALRENIRAREARAGAVGTLSDPFFSIELMDLSREKPYPLPGHAMETRYGISQMFPYPGKLSLEKEMSLLEVSMADAELREAELEITRLVREKYYDYVFVVESIRIVTEIRELLSSMIQIAEIKYATGQVSQQDVIRAQVELTMLINDIINFEAEKEVVQAELKALLNRPQEAPLSEPAGINTERVEIRTRDLIRRALEISPSLQMMRYEIEARELGVELSRKNYYPDFMVSVAPIQRDSRFDAWNAMFQINVPLWRAKYDSQVDEASSISDSSKLRLRSQENMKKAEVREGEIRVEAADKIRMLYETSLLPQAQLSFDSAIKNYQSGKIDFLTLLETERILKQTRIDYLGSIIMYHKRIAFLERAVGEDFEGKD